MGLGVGLEVGVISGVGVGLASGSVGLGVGLSVAWGVGSRASTLSANTCGVSLVFIPKLKKLAPTITPKINGATTLNIWPIIPY